MRKIALVLATAATLAVTAVAKPSTAHAHYYGYGPGIFGGLVAGAPITGIASSAYGYGPGYGYYGGYYPALRRCREKLTSCSEMTNEVRQGAKQRGRV